MNLFVGTIRKDYFKIIKELNNNLTNLLNEI